MTTKLSMSQEDPCLVSTDEHNEKTHESYRKKKSGLSVLEKLLLLLLFIAFIVVIALIAVVAKKDEDKAINQDVYLEETHRSCTSADCVVAAARIHSSVDLSVNPCEDFYQFTCGRWMKERVIPEDSPRITTFYNLRKDVSIVLKQLLEEEAEDDPGYVRKAKDLYVSCMNTKAMEEKGGKPLKDLLNNEFGGWPLLSPTWDATTFDMTDTLSRMWQIGSGALFRFYVYTNSKNSTMRTVKIDQTSFGMPGQKYYLVPRNDTMLMAYEELIQSTAMLLGADITTAKQGAKEIVDFEIELAKISVPDEERRDSNVLYNPMKLEEFQNEYPLILNWKSFIKGLFAADGVNVTVSDQEIIINRSPAYFNNLTSVLQATPKRIQANYLMWRVTFGLITKLSEEYRQIIQNYNKVVHGQNAPNPRHETCLTYTTHYMGLAVGKLFIKDHFNDDARTQTLEMIGNLQTAFNELLDDLDWMDSNTKLVAKDKNKHITSKIGYPQEITNETYLHHFYENYTYSPDDYFTNVLNSRKEGFKMGLRRLREPVDKNKWNEPPSTVNAFYSSAKNQILFPAGIFQPPFFSARYPKSLNYGGIGVVIGHEISHGFDDRGRQYDKNGNLVQWWSDSAIAKFKVKAQCIIDQYGNFTVKQVNMNINGINTQGENIADNGGLKQSFKAYRNWVASQGQEEKPLPGLEFTHNQLFFINFAQLWCGMMKDEDAVSRIRTGVHSPGEFRVIGSIQNSPDFSEAFSCKPGSLMSRKNKCTVW